MANWSAALHPRGIDGRFRLVAIGGLATSAGLQLVRQGHLRISRKKATRIQDPAARKKYQQRSRKISRALNIGSVTAGGIGVAAIAGEVLISSPTGRHAARFRNHRPKATYIVPKSAWSKANGRPSSTAFTGKVTMPARRRVFKGQGTTVKNNVGSQRPGRPKVEVHNITTLKKAGRWRNSGLNAAAVKAATRGKNGGLYGAAMRASMTGKKVKTYGRLARDLNRVRKHTRDRNNGNNRGR